ncbi:unnamed protein product [Paramecium sonneborni]|uniref:Uncharacterized protein n=1 Tax=Paramecium sonneborni TaxID=65129 RepID=A0A8S1RLX3_9CILI|nr:unnamed protein product [Paramecium sonneborni]
MGQESGIYQIIERDGGNTQKIERRGKWTYNSERYKSSQNLLVYGSKDNRLQCHEQIIKQLNNINFNMIHYQVTYQFLVFKYQKTNIYLNIKGIIQRDEQNIHIQTK